MEETWKPADLQWLEDEMENKLGLLKDAESRFWSLIKIKPEKWSLPPLGDLGGGFYVVAIFGNQVLWFNDIEDGFNISRYEKYGVIAEYSCDQNEFHHSIGYLYSDVLGDV